MLFGLPVILILEMETGSGFPVEGADGSCVCREELKTSCWSSHFICLVVLRYMDSITSGRTVTAKHKGSRNTLRSISVNNHYIEGLDNYKNTGRVHVKKTGQQTIIIENKSVHR